LEDQLENGKGDRCSLTAIVRHRLVS
jgi:hypothetical protein